eukprot:TRINITY_DN20846_c0_g1_i1.p1 TRINITY_DN20846_c0_g1~~TRINITY_DN20846_c0_g1_i1.p1  ORF type:complete len:956 (+),score=374.63 TRINITY_DN20846_c0_g1_i1:65-2869(+)
MEETEKDRKEEQDRKERDELAARYPMFSPVQIEEYRDIFHGYDRDGDNTIDTGELGSIFQEIGMMMSEDAIREMISMVDADGTGSIEFAEFLDLMSRKTLNEIIQEDEASMEDEAQPEDALLAMEDTSEKEYNVPELRRHIEVIKALQRGLGGSGCEPGAAPVPTSPQATPGSQDHTLQDDVSPTSADAAGDEEHVPRGGGEGDGTSPADVPIEIGVPEAVRRLQKERLLDYKMAQLGAMGLGCGAPLLPHEPPQGKPEEWDRDALSGYMADVLQDLEERLFEETGYDLVHCEDADVGVEADELQFTVEDAQLIERNLEQFAFACKKDPSLALGTEAFVLHATSNPYATVPKRMILPRVSDEAVIERHGFLDLNSQSVNDKYACSIAEVIKRDAARPSHKDPKLRAPPLIRHVEAQRNFLTSIGGSAILSAMATRGCLVQHVDLSHNDLGNRAANVPHGQNAVQQLAALEREMSSRPDRNPAAHKPDSCDSCAEWNRHRGFGSVLRKLLTGPSALQSLKVLRLTHGNLGDLECSQICEGLADNGHLYEIDLSHNKLGFQSAISLAEMLASNGDLRVFKVGWNRLTAAGTNYLLKEGLLGNGTLEEVDISWTGVQDLPGKPPDAVPTKTMVEGGGKLLGKVIGSLFLKKLSASHNSIGSEGAHAVATGLKANSTLMSLSLSHNPLSTDGVREILKAARDNSTLEELDLSATAAGPAIKGSRFSEDIEAELAEVQEKKRAQGGKKEGLPPAPWQSSEFYRHNCALFCPHCDRIVRSTRLHDELDVDHRLDGPRSGDGPNTPCHLKPKITKVRCTRCEKDQPPGTSCVQCGVAFCTALRPATVTCTSCGLEQDAAKECTACNAPLPYPSGITLSFAAQAHDASCRYPSPPGPERGFLPDDLPKTFQIVSTRMREMAAMAPKEDKKNAKDAKGKGKKK